MPVDAYASLPHYVEHLRPVWEALPDETRGSWLNGRLAGSNPVLVAGHVDGQRLRDRPVILLEHGAGQAYPGDPASARHGSYSGGDDWGHALGFLCPSERVAERWRSRYPDAVAVPVGCPKLDAWAGRRPLRSIHPIVAFSFHWDCPLVPETRSAWAHYVRSMPTIVAELREMGYQVVGHSHPRWRGQLAAAWGRLGVPHVDSFDQVMETAAVFVADNTSTLYEFAATGRPVVVLNAPWYRREVDHGLRFWSHVPGVQAADPIDVAPAVAVALSDGHLLRERRERAVAAAYVAVDGRAAERAASAVAVMLDR